MNRFQTLLSISTCAATLWQDFGSSWNHLAVVPAATLVGRCRLTVSKPELKARLVSALESKM
jgi:hypothetical protein